jgi:prepilin-type processing-associated H-X9-DG protein
VNWYASANNHYYGTFIAAGGNYGFVDGHSEWRQCRWGGGGNMVTSGAAQWMAIER